jgi:hypothetical protein
MFTVTIPRPDVTTEQVSQALRQGLGARYNVLPGMQVSLNPVGSPRPDDPEVIVVGIGSARLFHAQVTISRESGNTTLHVTPGGAMPTMRLVNRLFVARKVHAVLKDGPSPRRGAP